MDPGEFTSPLVAGAHIGQYTILSPLGGGHGHLSIWYDWDWAAAEREIQRTLALNPDSIDALRAPLEFSTLVAAEPDPRRRRTASGRPNASGGADAVARDTRLHAPDHPR